MIRIYLEQGQKRVIACAADWPGWCRSGKDEHAALAALLEYAPRFGKVVSAPQFNFLSPAGLENFEVIERINGNTTTDFGAPAITLMLDRRDFHQEDLTRYTALLQACWEAFDMAVAQAAGRELRKGPRGGGRDLGKIMEHVLEADLAYLQRLAWKPQKLSGSDLAVQIADTRRQITAALEQACQHGLPAQGPRGGVIWPPHYFVRRSAWHVLDHTWEIEDRLA